MNGEQNELERSIGASLLGITSDRVVAAAQALAVMQGVSQSPPHEFPLTSGYVDGDPYSVSFDDQPAQSITVSNNREVGSWQIIDNIRAATSSTAELRMRPKEYFRINIDEIYSLEDVIFILRMLTKNHMITEDYPEFENLKSRGLLLNSKGEKI